jgi:uncharacterized membrane protein (DUF485 family)
MDEDWYYSVADGQTAGPVTLSGMRAAIAGGVLKENDLVWHTSLGDWKRVVDVDCFVSTARTIPPTPTPPKSPPKIVPPPVAPAIEIDSARVKPRVSTKGWKNRLKHEASRPFAELSEQEIGARICVAVYLLCLLCGCFFAVLMLFSGALAATEGEGSVVLAAIVSAILFIVVMPLMGAVGICLGLAIYLFPSYMAYHRKHENLVPIIILNVALGGLFIGWIGALAWAFSSGRQDVKQVVEHVHIHRNEA